MYLKDLLPFNAYHKRHISNPDLGGYDNLIRMALTAKTFDEWVKVYRNAYWGSIKDSDSFYHEMLCSLRLVSMRAMMGSAPSENDVVEEVMSYTDFVTCRESGPLSGKDLEKEMKDFYSKHSI
jgi:hypothetical protein